MPLPASYTESALIGSGVEMPPHLALNNSLGVCVRDAERPPERGITDTLIGVQPAHLDHLILSQACSTVPDAEARHLRAFGLTASGDFIGGVTGVRIGFQMRRPNTANGSAVTEMGDDRHLGRRLVSGRQDVGDDAGDANAITELETSVPIADSGSLPYPAGAEGGVMKRDRAVPINLRPEPIRRCKVLSHQDSSWCQTPAVDAVRGHFAPLNCTRSFRVGAV